MNPESQVKNLLEIKPHPIVFICGLGGSGKTTYARKLAKEIENSNVVELDWYLTKSTKDRKEGIKLALESEITKDIEKKENPIHWYSWDSFINDISSFQASGELSLSSAWNQVTGEKDLDIELTFNGENGLIICEGIYLLHDEVSKIADYIIFIEISEQEARIHAEKRDSHRSNPEYLAKKAALAAKYDVPYFEMNQNKANLKLDSGSI